MISINFSFHAVVLIMVGINYPSAISYANLKQRINYNYNYNYNYYHYYY